MKSSNTDGGKEYLSNGPLYSLLALYMPLSVLTALIFLLRGFLPLFTVPLLASGIVGALAASFYYDFMKDTQSSRIAANIRAVVIVLVISYIFSLPFRRAAYGAERFVPDFSTVFAFFGTFYVWVSVIALKRLFSARKRFESYTESHQGTQLHEALYEDPYLLQYIDTRLSKTQRNYMLQYAFMGVMLFINIVYKVYLSPAFYVFLIIIAACGISIAGFFGIIRKEHYCAAKGMSLSAADRSKHILWIAVFAALSIVTALLLTSDASILPLSLVAGFFGGLLAVLQWFLRTIIMFVGRLLHMFWGLFDSGPAAEPEPMELDPFPFPSAPIQKSSPLLFWTLLQYAFIVLAVMFFVWFMVFPLANRVRALPGEMTFFQKLRYIAAEWGRGVLSALASFFAFITSGGLMRKLPRLRRRPSAEEIRQATGAVLGAYAQAKKSAIRQSVTLFARLIIWGGEARQVVWRPVHAPGEYCRLLTMAPGGESLNEKIIRCGELFEKALYSAELLSDMERKEFKDLVEEITSVV